MKIRPKVFELAHYLTWMGYVLFVNGKPCYLKSISPKSVSWIDSDGSWWLWEPDSGAYSTADNWAENKDWHFERTWMSKKNFIDWKG